MTVPQRAACDVQLAACTDELCATQPCTTIYHDAPCAKRSGWLDRLLPPDRDDARRGSPAERKRSTGGGHQIEAPTVPLAVGARRDAVTSSAAWCGLPACDGECDGSRLAGGLLFSELVSGRWP